MTRLLPNLSGVWIADLERCRFRSPAPVRLTIGIEHHTDTIVEKIVSELPDGTTQSASFEFRTDGVSRSAVKAGWEGVTLIVEAAVQSGGQTFQFRDYWTLSDDGSMLTMEHRDDALAGQICVFKRAVESPAG
jgi:hypothetical protein